MGRILDWIKDRLLTKLLDALQQHWQWIILGGWSWLWSWLDWNLIGSLTLILLGGYGAILDKRRRAEQIRKADKRADDANAKVEACKQDMNRTWLQSRSFELDPKKRRKAVVRFAHPQQKRESEELADVLKSNGWNVPDPTSFYPDKPDFSPDHSVMLELRDYSQYSEADARYGPVISHLTGHKAYTVDAEALETNKELEALNVKMRFTVYGPKPA